MLHLDKTVEGMDDAFMNRKMPFAEYLTECGEHPMNAGYTHAMKDKPFPKHYSAKYFFPDSGIEVSVIHGSLFHCGYDEPYEILISQGEGKQQGPLGYQTDEELYILLAKIAGGDYDVGNELES